MDNCVSSTFAVCKYNDVIKMAEQVWSYSVELFAPVSQRMFKLMYIGFDMPYNLYKWWIYQIIRNRNNFKKYYGRENYRFKKSSYNIYSYTCHRYKYIGGQNTTNTYKKLWFCFVSIKSMWIIFEKWWNTLWMLLRQKTLSTIIYRVMLHLFKFQ